jgi:gamma-glutamyltranspeptidase/glutathione hydrolase
VAELGGDVAAGRAHPAPDGDVRESRAPPRPTGRSAKGPPARTAIAWPRSTRRSSSGTAASSHARSTRSTPRSGLRDTTGERNGGLLRYDDLAAWEAKYEEPATLEFGRYTVAKCGAWGQGPVFLQQLAMLRHAGSRATPPIRPRGVHRVAEAAKLALADRLAWYGDPDFVDVPLADLLSDAYGETRWRQVRDTSAKALMPGSPGRRLPQLPDLEAAKRTLRQSEVRFGVGEPRSPSCRR